MNLLHGRVALLALLISTGSAVAGDLTVSITGLRSDAGRVLICLFSEASSRVDEFPDCDKGAPIRNDKIAISGGAAQISYKALPSGTYAIAFIHDENMDDALDTNFLGIPTEGIGVSNNPLLIGAPSFSQAEFKVAGNASLTIEAKYFLSSASR
jgi:uncharacterized protein (DUF2141 family)